MIIVQDSKGKDWKIRVTAGVMLEVCSDLDITIEKLQDLKISPTQVINLLPIVCRREMKEKEIKKEDFLDLWEMPELKAALLAFKSEFFDAFPELKITQLPGIETQEDGAETAAPLDAGPSETSSNLPAPSEPSPTTPSTSDSL